MIMPIFYLEPLNGDTKDPSWEASYLQEGCWVDAKSEAHARLRVENATAKMRDVVPGRKIVFPPWQQEQLVSCQKSDAPREFPADKILTRSGKLIDATWS